MTTSELNPPGTKHSVLMLAENETERQRWVGALNELQKLLRRNKLPKTVVSIFLDFKPLAVKTFKIPSLTCPTWQWSG